MTDIEIEELVKKLRQRMKRIGNEKINHIFHRYSAERFEAARVIEEQAERIAELEKRLASPNRHAYKVGFIAGKSHSIREAEKIEMRYQNIGDGRMPLMSVAQLVDSLERYSKCMPSSHRAQNVMGNAARLIRAIQGGQND